MTPRELVTSWRAQAAQLEAFGPDRAAAALLAAADELEKALAVETEELLTLRAAARRCGYSEDHLGRLVKAGRLANYGAPGAPRVKAGELPRKATIASDGNTTVSSEGRKSFALSTSRRIP